MLCNKHLQNLSGNHIHLFLGICCCPVFGWSRLLLTEAVLLLAADLGSNGRQLTQTRLCSSSSHPPWTRMLVKACLLTVTLEAPEGKRKHIRLLRSGLRTGTLPLPPTYVIGQSKSYGQATPRAGKYTPPMSKVWLQGRVKNWN